MFSQLCSLMFKMYNAYSEVLFQNSKFAWFWNEAEKYVVGYFRQFVDHIVGCKWLLQKDVA